MASATWYTLFLYNHFDYAKKLLICLFFDRATCDSVWPETSGGKSCFPLQVIPGQEIQALLESIKEITSASLLQLSVSANARRGADGGDPGDTAVTEKALRVSPSTSGST